MSKNILVSAGVALLVVVLGLVFFGRPSGITKVITERIGAIPGDTLPECVTRGDKRACHYEITCADRTTRLYTKGTGLGTSSVTGALYVANGTTTVGIGMDFATSTSHAATSSGVISPIQGVAFTTGQTRNIVIGSGDDTATYAGDSLQFNSGTTSQTFLMGAAANVIHLWATGTVAGITNTNNAFSCRGYLDVNEL